MSDAPVSFVPGPAHVRPEILAAMARPPVPHRSGEFEAMVARVQQALGALLGTSAPVFPVLAAATTSMEVALRGVARRRVLALDNGAFAARAARIAESLQLEVEVLTLPAGHAVDPEVVARALAAGDFDTVTVVHSESSTGALTDLGAVAGAVRDAGGAVLVVDAVSSLGGVAIDFDALGPDAVLVSASSKALACPPGVSVLAVGAGAAERARDSERGGYALDLARLVEWHGRGGVPNTPATPLLYALDAQLAAIAAEGMAERAERHRRMAGRVQAWAEDRFAVLAAEGARSPTVTAVENTRALDVDALLRECERRGFRMAHGYGGLRGATFRIGHLGDVTVEQTADLLAALDECIEAVGG